MYAMYILHISCTTMFRLHIIYICTYYAYPVALTSQWLGERYLIRCVGQSSPLKALRHLPPKLIGISDGLEEEGVLLHTLDAKGVVYTANPQHQNVILHFETAFIHASIGRETCHNGLLLGVNLTGHCLKVLTLQQYASAKCQ